MSPWFDDPLELTCCRCFSKFEHWDEEPESDFCPACRNILALSDEVQAEILGYLEKQIKEAA